MAGKSLRAWLYLHHTPELGPGQLLHLLKRFGQPEAVLAAGPAALQASGLAAELAESLAGAMRPGSVQQQRCKEDLCWLDSSDQHHILCLYDPDYPPLLQQISNPPAVLYLRGRRDALCLPAIAMVGSRKATRHGRDQAFGMAANFSRCGLAVVSGLALGIDSEAHKGSVSAHGHTVAVLGNGLKSIYPKSNARLADSICEQGLLISEFPLSAGPRDYHFPRRNRIIAGLSLGVLVVEATLRSGSLITARLAAEQNREVFALPGSVRNPQSRGCHQLIREGAALVESANDVLDLLNSCLQHFVSDLFRQDRDAITGPSLLLPPAEQAVLDCIDAEPVSFDVVQRRSAVKAGELSRLLLQLEIKGRIESSAGGYISL